MFKFRKKTIGYVSPLDRALAKFDALHPKSKPQLAEIAKYKRIYELRGD